MSSDRVHPSVVRLTEAGSTAPWRSRRPWWRWALIALLRRRFLTRAVSASDHHWQTACWRHGPKEVITRLPHGSVVSGHAGTSVPQMGSQTPRIAIHTSRHPPMLTLPVFLILPDGCWET